MRILIDAGLYVPRNATIREPVRCPSCHLESPPQAAFCASCGTRLASAGAPPTGGEAASSPPEAQASESPPSSLAGGRYTLGRLLGAGGMKRVFLGHDRRLDREVAIARVDLAGLDQAGRLRLEREAQAMARLGDHSNIVTVHDVIEEGGAIYIVTQHLAGGDLALRIARAPDGRLPIEDAVAIGIQLCRALEHAHARGVIHRDLKPANVWLAADGTAKLGDFGLALALDRSRLTADGMIVGTVAYMPPEQALGRPRDARSDLYALGATLYEMVTGRPPFTGDDVVAVLSQHLHTPPVAPSWLNPAVPQPLERLILELLAKDPAARPASAAAVRGRLQAAVAAAPAPASAAAVHDANPLDRLVGGVFVGRSQEIERLRAAFEETQSGRLRLLLLSGEPGIGKTRVAEELTTYARMRGADVLWGRCYEGGGAPPFWPWVQVVRAWLKDREPRELLADLGPGATDLAALVPEIHDVLPGLAAPPRLDPEQSRFRLFEGMTTLLRNASRRRPLVVILDDLHWADEASLLLLQFLARELGPARLLLVGTYRDVELRRGHPLAEALGELARERAAERVPLRGLTLDEVRRFIEQTAGVSPPPGLVETVHRETEGNPFFMSEVVRLLVAEGKLTREPDAGSWGHAIPQGVREVIGRRLNRLSPRCNEVLATAAVLGREFDSRLLARVSGQSEIELLDALEEAIAARLLVEVREGAARYRFSHALVRDTLYDELGAPRRVRLHRAAGEALDRGSAEIEGPRLAEVAHHFYQSVQAGGPEQAIAACERAAAWATSQQAWEDAALHLDRAVQMLEVMEQPDQRRLSELLVTLAERQSLGRDAERTRATALRAVAIARRLGDSRTLARGALAYGAHFPIIEAGRVDATMVGLLEEALAAVGEAGDPALRSPLLLRLAQELGFSGDFERINELLDEARRLAEASGDLALQARVAIGLQFGLQRANPDDLAGNAERLVPLAREIDDPSVEQLAWTELVAGALWLGDAERAWRAAAEVARLAAEIRTPMARYLGVRPQIVRAVLEGRFDEGLDLVRQSNQTAGDAFGGSTLQQWSGSVNYVVSRQRGTPISPERTLSLIERFLDLHTYRAYPVRRLHRRRRAQRSAPRARHPGRRRLRTRGAGCRVGGHHDDDRGSHLRPRRGALRGGRLRAAAADRGSVAGIGADGGVARPGRSPLGSARHARAAIRSRHRSPARCDRPQCAHGRAAVPGRGTPRDGGGARASWRRR